MSLQELHQRGPCRLHRAMLLVRDETARILDGLSLADPVSHIADRRLAGDDQLEA